MKKQILVTLTMTLLLLVPLAGTAQSGTEYNFRSTSAYSGQWNDRQTAPSLNADGSVNEAAYTAPGIHRAPKPVSTDTEWEERKEDIGGGLSTPIGDAILPLMLLAAAFCFVRFARSRKRLPALLASAIILLPACRSNVDINNIDTTSEVEMGLALPIGTINAHVGDFFQAGNNIYIDTLENRGVITWRDTFSIQRNYHQVDLSQYISQTELSLKVYDRLNEKGLIGPNGKVTGTGLPVTLTFDLPLALSGINHPDSIGKERLDSARIENARFSSYISRMNLPLEWDWIDQVTIDLGEQVARPAGNEVVVYTRDSAANDYGQELPINVDHFTLCLMKNRHLDPSSPSDVQKYATNVVDSCKFRVNFTITIPAGQEVNVPANAAFGYDLRVQFIDYTAVWGMFVHSKDMYNADVIDVSENWNSLAFLEQSSLPFAEPRIDMNIVTQVAGAMFVEGDYLYTVDTKGNTTYADFNGSRNLVIYFSPDQYLDPIHSAIGDSTTNMKIRFDKDNGSLNKLFRNMPQKMGYSFNLDFNFQRTPQIRIVPNSSVRVDASCTLPLIFEQGLHFQFSDTLRDVSLSQFSIDSLLGNAAVVDTIKTTDVSLYLTASNTVPLDLKICLHCLDADGNVMTDPADPSQPLSLFSPDTIDIVAPKFDYSMGTWNMTEPGKTLVTAALTKQRVEQFPKIKSIVYTIILDDESLAEAYAKGMNNVRITDDSGLSLKLGLTAQLDAVLNFNATNNNPK